MSNFLKYLIASFVFILSLVSYDLYQAYRSSKYNILSIKDEVMLKLNLSPLGAFTEIELSPSVVFSDASGIWRHTHTDDQASERISAIEWHRVDKADTIFIINLINEQLRDHNKINLEAAVFAAKDSSSFYETRSDKYNIFIVFFETSVYIYVFEI